MASRKNAQIPTFYEQGVWERDKKKKKKKKRR